MKKIILNEVQVEKLMGKVVSEQQSEHRYHMNVKCYYDYHNLTYRGKEISDINGSELRVSFLIDQEHRQYGISSIILYGIKGQNTIEIDVEYYETEDNEQTVPIELNVNWDTQLKLDEDDTLGYIGIGDHSDVELMNDDEGNIVIKMINLTYNSI